VLSRSWAILGWLPDLLGRVTLVIAAVVFILSVAQFVWGVVMGGWPSYALYMTTILTVGMGALLVMVAALIGRGQVVVNLQSTASASADAPPAAQQTTVFASLRTEWAGLKWRYLGRRITAFCPRDGHEHSRLLFVNAAHDTDVREQVPTGYEGTSYWILTCFVDESHDVPLGGRNAFFQHDFEAAQKIAEERLLSQTRE
jgi:hypothetical protein